MGVVYFSIIPTFEPSRYCKCWIVCFYNNFPKASDNPICHVRPHARNAQDVDELPDGRMFPKQCFWLNKEYILSQLDENFLEE